MEHLSSQTERLSTQSHSMFPKLSLLPLKLQRKIWEFTLSPRILTIDHITCCTTRSPVIAGRRYPPLIVRYRLNSWGQIVANGETPSKPYNPRVKTYTVIEGVHPDMKATPYFAMPYFQKLLRERCDSDEERKYLSEQEERFKEAFIRVPPKAPVALHICHESRLVALKQYSRGFANTHNATYNSFISTFINSGLGERKIWIDWSRDTILFLGWATKGGFGDDGCTLIRHLAIIAERRHTKRGRMRRVVFDRPAWDERLVRLVDELKVLKSIDVLVPRVMEEGWVRDEVGGGCGFGEQVRGMMVDVIAYPQLSVPAFVNRKDEARDVVVRVKELEAEASGGYEYTDRKCSDNPWW